VESVLKKKGKAAVGGKQQLRGVCVVC